VKVTNTNVQCQPKILRAKSRSTMEETGVLPGQYWQWLPGEAFPMVDLRWAL
jgi:hypothetical protein